MSENQEMLDAVDEKEFDFSSDSEVQVVESVFNITEFEEAETESDNGSGVQHVLTFESPDWPYPITLRRFVSYTPADPNKNTDWVKRQRGTLKKIAKAAIGKPGYSTDPNSENYPVGKQVKATTGEDSDGRPTLKRFKKVG